MGDRFANIEKAVRQIEKNCGDLIKSSAYYETQPWGKHDQELFINNVICIETQLPATRLLRNLKEIEIGLGRKRFEKWGERRIDIDILFYDDEIIDTRELKVPHPYIQMRNFVLRPLFDLAPELYHPGLKKDISYLMKHATDPLKVHKLEHALK